eukprot:scaffold5067_cov65-Phaeocystis_antarctica.AAC.3
MRENLGACSQGPVQPGTPAPCVRARASAAWGGAPHRPPHRPSASPLARPPARLTTRRPSTRTLALAPCAAIGP